MRRLSRQARVVACAAALVAAPAGAREPSDPAAAEALFADGKQLMQRGDYEQACPKLEESYRLDPATGALLALALCHEGQARLATAWAELMEVAALAHAERNPEREHAARQRAEILRARLAFLSLRINPALAQSPGLSIEHDGVQLRPAAWGTEIPVDPGRHVLRASAPGRKPWQAEVIIARPAQREVVEVPALALVAPRRLPPTASPTSATSPKMSPLRVAGVALIGAGTTGLLFAGGALWRALSQDAMADGNCTPPPCNSTGARQRATAIEAGDIATAASLTGGVLLGTGIALFVVGRPKPHAEPKPGWAVAVTRGGLALRRDF